MAILVLDDDVLIREAMVLALGGKYSVAMASNFSQALAVLDKEELDGAIIDIDLNDPEHTGVDFLLAFKKKYPDKPALIQSGYHDIPTVVRCIKLGADDYLDKPFNAEAVQLKLSKVFEAARRNRVFRRAFEKNQILQEIIGSTEGILRAKHLIEKAAGMRILLYGETGVGKTPFAWYSNQVLSCLEGQVRPFEQMNCAAINHEQFQDQLFGHKKGAFTGAISDKRGLVEIASGGDLFLDEIGEMPLETQALFLTFLDSMEYYRLGDDKKRKADVRIIAATNRNLKQMVEAGKFRRDLYSRISQVVVEIPPLRERISDIGELVEHFVILFCGVAKPIDNKIIELFMGYQWAEGNVRELRDAVEYVCMVSSESKTIGMEHLPERYQPVTEKVPFSIAEKEGNGKLAQYGLEKYLCYMEKSILEKAYSDCDGNVQGMAQALKISTATLYRRLRKYNFPALGRSTDLFNL